MLGGIGIGIHEQSRAELQPHRASTSIDWELIFCSIFTSLFAPTGVAYGMFYQTKTFGDEEQL